MVSAEGAAFINSSPRRELVHRQIASDESVIHVHIVARLEASRSGDFQSPFVITGRFQIAPPWFKLLGMTVNHAHIHGASFTRINTGVFRRTLL
jgi:hypothetical protein